MSVSSIIGGGLRLIRTQPRVVAIWAGVYVLGTMVVTAALRPLTASMMMAQQQNAASGVRTAPFSLPQFAELVGLEFISAVLLMIAFAAVVRAVATPTEDRFAYLRIGMDELRLIGLAILLALLALAAELAAVVLVVLLVMLAGFIMGKTGATVVGIVAGITLFCALVYAQLRLSLTGALTVIEHRIVIKDGWRATKGHVWTLFAAFLLMGLAYAIVAIIVIAIASPQLLSAYASLNPQAIQAAAQAQYGTGASYLTPSFVLRTILGAILAVPMGVILLGGVATAAVELGGVPNSVAAEFA